MTRHMTRTPQPHRWQEGESGNPKGRPPKKRILTEMLRLRSEDVVTVGGEVISARDALAKAVWQLALTGEVWLAGRKLRAETVTEWASVVKWLYGHIEPPTAAEPEQEPEMVVRIVRVDND